MGVKGLQAGKTQGQSAGQSFLGTQRTQAGTFEERGGEAAARPSPPPWLEVELCKSASRLSPDQQSAILPLHCGARTSMVQGTRSLLLLSYSFTTKRERQNHVTFGCLLSSLIRASLSPPHYRPWRATVITLLHENTGRNYVSGAGSRLR